MGRGKCINFFIEKQYAKLVNLCEAVGVTDKAMSGRHECVCLFGTSRVR